MPLKRRAGAAGRGDPGELILDVGEPYEPRRDPTGRSLSSGRPILGDGGASGLATLLLGDMLSRLARGVSGRLATGGYRLAASWERERGLAAGGLSAPGREPWELRRRAGNGRSGVRARTGRAAGVRVRPLGRCLSGILTKPKMIVTSIFIHESECAG